MENTYKYEIRLAIIGIECGKNDKHEHLIRKLERFTDRIAGAEAEKQNSDQTGKEFLQGDF